MKAPAITAQPEVAPPSSLREYIKSLGPGFVVAMSWLGASLMLPGYTNRWWENGILFVVAAIGLWASWQVINGLIDLAGTVVGG